MEMYDVLSKLKAIENPNEDQIRAIENAEKMNNPTNPSATNPLMPETQQVSATGQEVYQAVAEESPTEYARLAGVQTLNVQTDTPATTNESVETKEKALTEAEWFVRATDLMNYEIDVEANSEQEAEAKAYDILQSEDKEDYSVGGEGAIVQSVQMYEGVEKTIEEAKPDFLDLDKDGDKEESMKKAAKDKEEMKEDDATPEQYKKNEKVEEAEEVLEYYDPKHVADIVKKHEANGHKVQMDRPEDDAQGFTVTFKDGTRRHYKYTKTGAKVTSLEPEDALVDPDAPKRERGRPKKEGIGEEEVEEKAINPYAVGMAQAMKSTGDEPPLKKSTIKKAHDIAKAVKKNESEELDLDSMMEDFEKKYAEQLNEGVQLTQSIDDQGNESVNLNANGEHVGMIKDLLKLSGMRSDGYEEYKGQEEQVEEERDIEYTNTPREKTTTADAQLKDMSGGVNGPKPASAAKSNSNPLHEKDLAESMMDLYKDYKGS